MTKQIIYKDQKMFGSYLAGLWEGDGHALIPKTNARPSLHITFNIKDLPLAQKLFNLLTAKCNGIKVGSIRYKTEQNACVLNISSIEGLKLMVNQINGNLKTPKIYRINILIDWLKNKHNIQIKKLPMCSKALCSNAWLAGFIDADGSFGVRQTQKTNLIKKRHTSCRFRLEQRMFDPTTNESYESLLKRIAEFLGVKLGTRKQKQSGRSYYLISMDSAKSKKLLRAYLETFSLLSSKYLDYMDWCRVDDLMISNEHYIQEQRIKQIKNAMNNSRTIFNWDHLNQL